MTALTISTHRMGRIPGQVPNKERLDLIREVSKTDKPSRIDDHGDLPRPTASSVVRGLGLDRVKETQWTQLIRDTATPTATTLVVRKAVIAKLLEEKAAPELRRALLQRTLRYHRDLKKSFVEDELRKAGPFIGPKGGKWADAKHTIPWKKEKPKKRAKIDFKKRVLGASDPIAFYTAMREWYESDPKGLKALDPLRRWGRIPWAEVSKELSDPNHPEHKESLDSVKDFQAQMKDRLSGAHRKRAIAAGKVEAAEQKYEAQGVEVDPFEPVKLEALADKKVWLYHGTSSKLLPRLKKDGIEPAREHGKQSNVGATAMTEASPDFVFLTAKTDGAASADFYAKNAARKHGGKPVVVRVLVDGSDLDYDPDDVDIQSGSYQFVIDRVAPGEIMEIGGEKVKKSLSGQGLEDELEKAAHHKYLRRVPSKRKGRKWDYVYAKQSQHHDVEFQVGEKIRLSHGPQAGHYEVASLHGPYVTVKHDETGHEVTIHKSKLAEMFRDEHHGADTTRARETKAAREERQKQAREKARRAYNATESANRTKDKASHQKAAEAHTAAADAGAKNANLHRQLAEVHQRAVASHGALEGMIQGDKAPKLVIRLERKPPPDNLGTKAQSYRALMSELKDLPRDFHAKDLAYQRWKDGRAQKPVPWEGGELDSVNEALGLKKPSRHERLSGRTKDYRVSSTREAWDRLTVGVTKWDDPKIEQAFEILRDVPGLEQIRVPQDALARITAKGATKEQEEYYREKLAAQEAGSHEADPEELEVEGDVDTSFDFGWNAEEEHAKSLARIGNRLVHVRSLRKADPRGGTYHRRVPRPGGGYRYYYDAEQYDRHPDRHVHGPEAKAQRTHKAVVTHLETAGKGGAELKAFKGLVKGHGAEGLVTAVRKGIDAGDIVHRKGRLYHKSSAPKRKKTKAKKARLKPKAA